MFALKAFRTCPLIICAENYAMTTPSMIARFMGPTWIPPGSCRPQVGPIWATWTLLSGHGMETPMALMALCDGLLFSHRVSNADIFTRGQFWPSGIVVACVCVSVCLCVCVSVNHELVRVIIHQPFKLGSPNLVQRSKTPWLRSLLFFGAIDLDLKGQI